MSDIRSHAQFYNIANKLLHRRKTITLPNYECAESLANKFADYFDEKIQRIRTTLQTPHSCAIDCTVCTNRPDTDCQLSSFETVTRAEITQVLSKSPSKTCKLDPMPTHFVKQCHDVMAVPITNIINKCLIDGMPDQMKAAIITPILKKASLDSETLKSYRPISNMSFLSKLLERVVAVRLIAHMRDNDLYMPLQSAYRQNCSTETTTTLHYYTSMTA